MSALSDILVNGECLDLIAAVGDRNEREWSHAPVALCGEVFIETGSGRGYSMETAMRMGFIELHGIEVCKENYDFCVARLGTPSHLRWHWGSSPDVLPTIMDRNRRTLFWLDAQ